MTDPSAQWRTAGEFALAKLGEFGAGQDRLAFVLDPELRLSWPEGTDAGVTDSVGRHWRVHAYRGNDMALRARLRSQERAAIWVRPAPLEGPSSIDLTTLSDLVGRADAFVDLSLGGMLGSVLPGIPLPRELADWTPQAGEDPREFTTALKRVLEHRGKPVSKRHVMAAAVIQESSKVSADVAWLDDASLATLLMSYARLLATIGTQGVTRASAGTFTHAASLLPATGSGLRATEVAKIVIDWPPTVLVDCIYLLSAARRHGIADPIAALANQGLAAPEVVTAVANAPALRGELISAADALNLDVDARQCVAQSAEKRLDSACLRKLQALLSKRSADWPGEPAAAVRTALLLTEVEGLTAGGTTVMTAASAESAVGAPRLVAAANTLANLGVSLSRYITMLAGQPDIPALDLEGLLRFYVGGLATAEFDLGTALRGIRSLNQVLGDQKLLSTFVDGIRSQCASLRAKCDARLIALLGSIGSTAVSSSVAAHRWWPDVVAPGCRSRPGSRVWVLVFDGLRWDLWERIVRPEFERAGWEMSVRPGLSLLPSETSLCRKALLAGNPPAHWGAPGMQPSEETLARTAVAQALGADITMTYRLHAEGADDDAVEAPELARVNVWIYGTPDHQVHQPGASLRDVGSQLRSYLTGNVLPELRELVGPEDLLYVGSDHGFTRVSGSETRYVSVPADRVMDRYIELSDDDDLGDLPGLTVNQAGARRWQVATGDLVFLPIGASVPAARYRHGGATLAEMVVPLATLTQRSRSAAEPQLELLGPAELDEDVAGVYTARITNPSAEEIRGQLLIESNRGVLMPRTPIAVGAGAKAERKREVTGQEGLEWIRARLLQGSSTIAARTLRVGVRLKPGIRLTGLEDFDDDL